MLHLPENLEDELTKAMIAIEKGLEVEYISSVEGYGIKKSVAQGIEQGRREAEERFEQEQLEKPKSIARGMFSVEGLNDERIAEIAGLSIAEVVQLRLETKH